MEALLLIVLVTVVSILVYVLREHKLRQERDWKVWTRTSSYPPAMPAVISETSVAELLQPLDTAKFQALNAEGYSIVPSAVAPDGSIIGVEVVKPTTYSIVTENKKDKDNTKDNIPVTSMTKKQLDTYLSQPARSSSRYHNSSKNEALVYSEAHRLASLDPEEVVYLNDKQWFHPDACEAYPSRATYGEELLMTIKGTWILKKPKAYSSGYDYQIISKKDAFLFLESNGFNELACELAPHNPINEL